MIASFIDVFNKNGVKKKLI